MKNKFFVAKNDVHTFSIVDTNIAKGLAIILLMYHHCFHFQTLEMLDTLPDFFPVSIDIAAAVCHSFKLCVGIFAFVTGYGLFVSISKLDFTRKNVTRWVSNRLVKTMSGFWFVYLCVFIVTFAIDRYPVTRYAVDGASVIEQTFYGIVDMLGLANLFGTPTLIATWWYMSTAVVFICIMPVLYKFTQRFGYLLAFLIASILPRIFVLKSDIGKCSIAFLGAVLFGMLFAKYNLFERVCSFCITKNKRLSDVLVLLLFCVLIILVPVIDSRIPWDVFWEFDFVIAPVIFVCFSKRYLSAILVLRNILHFIGRHSMNIYLIHTFIRFVYLKDFLYSFKYAILIPWVLLAISLVLSIVIELLKKLLRYNKLVEFLIRI